MTNIVTGAFDNLLFADLRRLHEASRDGALHVQLWSDELVQRQTGKPPRFPQEERDYFLQALRFVRHVQILNQPLPEQIPPITAAQLLEYPTDEFFKSSTMWELPTNRKKVVVTGCYDYFHSGHVRFFEEASELGDLYVIVGSNANIRLLKGDHHPLFPALQRQYIVSMVRHVRQALISTGSGWMDAEPEFDRINPDIYVVNEDGDKQEKKDWCAKHGVEYRVLTRLPRPGLPRRQSTFLRGF